MNNTEELSKPVGFVGRKSFSLLAEGNLGAISPNAAFGEAPVYSHVYVAALIAQLEAAQREIPSLKMNLSDAGCLISEWKQRVEDAESRVNRLEIKLSEAEEKLLTPIDLPGSFDSDPCGNGDYAMDADAVIAAIYKAGFLLQEDKNAQS